MLAVGNFSFMFLNIKNQRGGFTLIELLVVISIIGLLAAIVLVSLNDSRTSARDAKRRGDLRGLQTALELYYHDNNAYPGEVHCTDTSVGVYACGNPVTGASDDWASNSDLQALVSGGYVSSLPVDPTNNGTYYYQWEPNGPGQGSCTSTVCEYWLRARLEEGGFFCVGQTCP